MSQKYSHVKFHPEDPENMFVFKGVIDQPDWTRRKREQHLIVNVYKENTFWSTSSILGSVGGTLDLTIGFSCSSYMRTAFIMASKMVYGLKRILSNHAILDWNVSCNFERSMMADDLNVRWNICVVNTWKWNGECECYHLIMWFSTIFFQAKVVKPRIQLTR